MAGDAPLPESPPATVPDPLPESPPKPAPTAEFNLTDPDCSRMRQGQGRGVRLSYNAQTAVDADSHLIVGARVSRNANDRNELAPTVASIPAALGVPGTVLADSGYINADHFETVAQRGSEPLVAMRGAGRPAAVEAEAAGASGRRRRQWRDPRLRAMERRMQEPDARQQSARRKCTVEPIFGTIKAAMGFRRFHLRGQDKVAGEWGLVTLAYNMKRMHKMGAGALLQAA